MNINKDEKIIEFYAAVYNQKSRLRIEGDRKVIEIIKEKAFENAIGNSYVYATLLHDESFQFANTNNILQLKSDDYGLKATIQFTDENEYNRISKLIEEMDLKEASFKASTNDYSEEIKDDITYRYINTIKEIIDVSLVTVGRYANTIILQRDDNTEINNINMVEENKVEETEKEEVNEENLDVSGDTKVIKVVEIESETKEDETKEEVNEEEIKVEQVEEKEIVNSTKELKNNIKKENKKMDKNYLQLLRDAAINGETILLERAGEVTTTSSANAIGKSVGELSITPLNTVWEKMGVDMYKNAQGTIMLPYKSAAVGQKVAELAALTKDSITVNGNLLTPQRFGYTFEITKETIAAAGDDYLKKLVEDGQKAAMRKFETALFEKLVAGATEVASASDISVDSFNDLEGAIESDGDIIFVSSKKTFTKAKSTKLDAGSGLFLATKTGKNEGEVLGYDYLFSSNFVTSGTTEYIVAADFANAVAVADWNQTEVIFDHYTRKKEGIVEVTVNLLMDSAIKNPELIVRTPDLDTEA